MSRSIDRRDVLRCGLVALAAPIEMGMTRQADRGVRSFRLVEPAGLRRFGYPVQTQIPGASEGLHFRLIRDGRAIPAQFRTVDGPGGRKDVILDFVASPGPLETSHYQVQFGREVEPGPEPAGAFKVERRDSQILISQGSALTFEIAEDLTGFLRSVGSPRLSYLRNDSAGLSILERGGTSFVPVASTEKRNAIKTTVSRQGPFAVGLRSEWPGPGDARSVLNLTIPHSKSWVQAVWFVDDPNRRIAGLGLDLNLLIEGSPTLLDLGAGSTVYGQLKGNQRSELIAGKAVGETEPESGTGWVVRSGDGARPPILAASTAESPRAAEGWAHVMDARRCTALAVANFGRVGAREMIRVTSDGKLALTREFALGDSEPKVGPKTLEFWLHFVPMPVQVGAATSPQAILAPLIVEWDRPSA